MKGEVLAALHVRRGLNHEKAVMIIHAFGRMKGPTPTNLSVVTTLSRS